MLTNYETDTQNLLQKPGAVTPLYNTTSIDRWINLARGQLAGESECIWISATVSTTIGQRNYNFSALNTGVSATNGIAGAIHVRSISYNVGSGRQWIPSRPTEWFDLYSLNNPVPVNGPPTSWAQYGQGSATSGTGSASSGSFFLDPPPDAVYVLNCSCICYPIALVDDTTVEAIPYLWTDAVPFFAAYYALMSAQSGARQGEAARLYEMYKEFSARARQASNPDTLRWQYRQAVDLTQPQKLGLQPPARGG